MNKHAFPLETDTRVLINTALTNLGWVLDPASPNRNVYCEQAKTDKDRKRLNGKRPDYMLYENDTDQPLIIIEVKRPGSRLDIALEQGIDYARAINAPLVFATDGVFCRSYHVGANRPPILNGEEIDELIRESLALKYLTQYEVNTISPKVQYDRRELIKIFDEANNLLRGEGLRAGIERFGEFANILFLKLISESEEAKGNNARLKPNFRWGKIMTLPADIRIGYINETVFPELNRLYDSSEIFTPLQIKDPSILKDIMQKLNPLTLTDVDSDVKGDAFEYFLKASTATKNDLGEYFTPRHIVKTMVRLVNPQIGETIYDPFCGTGGFLIESYRYIYNNMLRNDENIKFLRESTIYGNEITNTARITKMNMILAGDGHSNIKMCDSLANPIDGEKTYTDKEGKMHHYGYDIVIANMPYSQKTKYGELYDVPNTNGDSICVQHCIKAVNSMSLNGRMALVVPEGFLFRKELTKTREYLLEHCEIQSIISLPQGVFLPYTNVKTDIIFATKVNKKVKPKEKKKAYWYFDVKSDGYTLDNQRRKLETPSDLAKYEEYRKLDETQSSEMMAVGFEVVPIEKVKNNSYILVGSRYREQNKIEAIFQIVSFGDISTITRGVNYKKQQQTTFATKNVVLTSDNISLDGELYITKKIYVDDSAVFPEEKRLRKDDIFICMSSGSKEHIGKVAYIEEDTNYYAGGFTGIIRTNKHHCLPKFLYFYLLYSPRYKEELRILTQGATINNISNNINSISIPLPPIEIQTKIVNELERYNQLVFNAKSTLRNYVPVIKTTTTNYQALGKLVEFMPSKNEISNTPEDTEVSFVPMSVLNTHDIYFEPEETRSLSDVLSGYTYFRDGDVLLAKISPCFENGKAGLASHLSNGIGFGSTEYIVMRAKRDLIYPEWLFYQINTIDFITQGKTYMTGTAGQQRIDINYVKQHMIPVPSLDEQKQILIDIETERSLIESSKKIISLFSKKIESVIINLWKE